MREAVAAEETMDGGDEMLVPGLDWKDAENGTNGALELEHDIR